MDKNYVIQILDGCGFYATTGIKVLLERCLITIGIKNKIMMHDLLRDMGRDIVHAENPDFPGERSRLWNPEDVNDLLIDKAGTEKIEGLVLNLPSLEETSFSTEALRNMKRLRLLQLNYVRLAGEYQCLFKKLRWLCWHGFSLEFIPIELCQPNIVAIDMRYSSLKQVLCQDSGLLDKLKILNLSHSHDLTQSPDFSKLPNLEKLILKDCKRLAKVHESIGDLKSLVLVNLKDCETLEALPGSLDKLKSVITLVLDGCSRLRSLPDNLGNMASLVNLSADGTAIEKVPPSIGRLETLVYLSLRNLKCYLQLPSLRGLCSLKGLNLADSNLMEVPNDIGSSLPCLKRLYLDNNNFRSLPSLRGLSKLEGLYLNGCINLVEMTDLPKSSLYLCMEDCSAFERMPDLSGLSLNVNLSSPKLVEFPGLYSALNSGLRLRMSTHNVIDFILKDSTLQGWTGCAMMKPVGRQIPTWFNHVNEGTEVRFEVPKEIGCNANAFAVCLASCPVLYNDRRFRPGLHHTTIYAINHTKRTCFVNDMTEADNGDNIWLRNLPLPETEFNLEEGDSVHVIAIRRCVEVKKIGVRLLCDKAMIADRGSYQLTYSKSIPYKKALKDLLVEVEWISPSDSIPRTEVLKLKEALKDIDAEVDDFDEDYDEDDENDDEEDQDDDANDEDDDNHDDEDGDDYVS